MFGKIRAALAPAGGPKVLLACAAIAWGLGQLQTLAQERQEHLDHLDEATKAYQDALREAQAAMHAHLDTLKPAAPEPFPFRRDYSENPHASWCANATTDHTFCVRPAAEEPDPEGALS